MTLTNVKIILSKNNRTDVKVYAGTNSSDTSKLQFTILGNLTSGSISSIYLTNGNVLIVRE